MCFPIVYVAPHREGKRIGFKRMPCMQLVFMRLTREMTNLFCLYICEIRNRPASAKASISHQPKCVTYNFVQSFFFLLYEYCVNLLFSLLLPRFSHLLYVCIFCAVRSLFSSLSLLNPVWIFKSSNESNMVK